MAAKKETAKVAAEIKNLNVQRIKVKVVGDTPLIMHKWSEKAKKMMLAAQQGKKAGKQKEVRNTVREFIDSMYWLSHKPVLNDNATEEEKTRYANAKTELDNLLTVNEKKQIIDDAAVHGAHAVTQEQVKALTVETAIPSSLRNAFL